MKATEWQNTYWKGGADGILVFVRRYPLMLRRYTALMQPQTGLFSAAIATLMGVARISEPPREPYRTSKDENQKSPFLNESCCSQQVPGVSLDQRSSSTRCSYTPRLTRRCLSILLISSSLGVPAPSTDLPTIVLGSDIASEQANSQSSRCMDDLLGRFVLGPSQPRLSSGDTPCVDQGHCAGFPRWHEIMDLFRDKLRSM